MTASSAAAAPLRTLIIGSNGQLATELKRAPRRAEVDLIAGDELDLTATAALEQALDRIAPRLILNAAAYTAVDRAETERSQAFALNQAGPATLARWCAAHGAALVHVSTDYVFDGTKEGAYVETDPVAPIGVYGESKLAGESAIRESLPEHVILRTSWVFSAHGQNFVKTMLRLAAERDELRVVADQFGRPTAAADLAHAMLQLAARLQRESTLLWGLYHFAGAGPTSWHGFAQAIIDEQAAFTGKRPKVTPISTADYPTPAKRPANSVLDTGRFEQSFRLQPASWRDSLGAVVKRLLAA